MSQWCSGTFGAPRALTDGLRFVDKGGGSSVSASPRGRR